MHPLFWLALSAVPFLIWFWWEDRGVIDDKRDAYEMYRRGREGYCDRIRLRD